jgi:Ca2+-binding RTX toxin-like protein
MTCWRGRGADDDVLLGNAGDDWLRGSSGRDTLFGGEGDDVVRGQGASGDVLSGGPGDDRLAGGPGTDRLVEVGDVSLILTDAALEGFGHDELMELEVAEFVTGASDNGIDARAFSGYAGVESGDGDDLVIAPQGGSFVFGGRGRDTLVGGAGNDRLFGVC